MTIICALEVYHVVKALTKEPLYSQQDIQIGYLPRQGYIHNSTQIYFTYLFVIVAIMFTCIATRKTK